MGFWEGVVIRSKDESFEERRGASREYFLDNDISGLLEEGNLQFFIADRRTFDWLFGMATTTENEFDQQVATLRSAFVQYPGMYPSEGFF